MGLGINVYFSLNGLHSTQIGLCECVCSFVCGFLNVIGMYPPYYLTARLQSDTN